MFPGDHYQHFLFHTPSRTNKLSTREMSRKFGRNFSIRVHESLRNERINALRRQLNDHQKPDWMKGN